MLGFSPCKMRRRSRRHSKLAMINTVSNRLATLPTRQWASAPNDLVIAANRRSVPTAIAGNPEPTNQNWGHQRAATDASQPNDDADQQTDEWQMDICEQVGHTTMLGTRAGP